MSVVVRGSPEPTDWVEPCEVQFDYGNVTDDLFDLDELFHDIEEYRDKCKLHMYALSGDAQKENDATHFVAISMGEEEGVGKLLLIDQVVDGPFLLLLSQGDRLKGFHCDDCAVGWVEWFVAMQPFWKERHHEDRSPKDKVEETLH